MSQVIHVLLVEDDPIFATLVREVISSGSRDHADETFELTHCASLEKAKLHLQEADRVDVILLDLTLPDSKGLETYSRMRDAVPGVSIIALTGMDDRELATRMMQHGAQDYLVKGQFDIHALQRSIRYAMERNRLRQELQEKTDRLAVREENYRNLISSNHDGMVVLDSDFRILYANPAAETLLGKSAQELHGRPFPHDCNPSATTEIDLTREAAPATAELRCFTAQWEGQKAYLVSMRDITKVKEAEAFMKRTNEELEERVAERTRELERENAERRRVEEELRQVVDRLARSNIELERFAYVASHDLREPLRPIVNYCDLLERRYADQLDQTARNYLRFARQGAHRLYDMIRSLLEYSRLDVHTQRFQPVDCNDLLCKVIEELRMAIEENEANLAWNDLPTVNGNGLLLMQVFQNLISNALKFRSESPPLIEVSAQSIDGFWRFAVADNGIGLRTEDGAEVFEIFKRLHRSPDYPGAGIGLAVCKKIVLHHGGHIWVEGEHGKGTTFYFTISQEPPEETETVLSKAGS